MAVLRNGSRGDEVLELQKKLNQSGYQLDEDGIYGNKTAAAVRDYQSKNGLSVDGIYGDQTRNSLYATKAETPGNTQATAPTAAPYKSYTGVSETTNKQLQQIEQGYQPSATVQSAMDYLEQLKTKAPGAYTSPYDSQIQSLYQQIVGRQPYESPTGDELRNLYMQISGRKDFTYDPSTDPTYQIYREQAMRNGMMAMQDTMGQAAALNGGYGSSYGQAVGQQQYNRYLADLNAIVPDLYDAAYNRYQSEGEQLYRQYALLADKEQQDYNRWQDQGQQMLDQYGLLLDREQQAYGRYQDDLDRYNQQLSIALGAYESERDFGYDQYRAQMDYWTQRAQLENQDYWDTLAALNSGGGSGGGGSGGRGSNLKEPTAAMWEEARKIASDEDAEFFSRKYENAYNLDGIFDWLGSQGIGEPNLVTTRQDASDGKWSQDAYNEIAALIEKKKKDPGSVNMSLEELYAELNALRDNRKYITGLSYYNQ